MKVLWSNNRKSGVVCLEFLHERRSILGGTWRRPYEFKGWDDFICGLRKHLHGDLSDAMVIGDELTIVYFGDMIKYTLSE